MEQTALRQKHVTNNDEIIPPMVRRWGEWRSRKAHHRQKQHTQHQRPQHPLGGPRHTIGGHNQGAEHGRHKRRNPQHQLLGATQTLQMLGGDELWQHGLEGGLVERRRHGPPHDQHVDDPRWDGITLEDQPHQWHGRHDLGNAHDVLARPPITQHTSHWGQQHTRHQAQGRRPAHSLG